MAIVTGHNRDRAVPRPAWVRRHDSQHEGLVAALMLSLVIVGIVVFLFWGQLVRFAVTGAWFHVPTAAADRPAEGAIPPGPAVVVSLDQPVVASAVVVDEARTAWAGNGEAPASSAASDRVVSEQSIADHDLAVVAARPLPSEDSDGGRAAAEDAAAAPPVPAALLAPTAAPVAPTAAPAATAVPRPTQVAAPAATAGAGAGRRARIVRTGGRGVVLYSAPRQGARLPAGILEGAIVSILDTSGSEWTRVHGGGQSGWVRSEFLAPAN